MLFWTRHANLRRVENYIYDPSARIIKNPLNSTVFRRLNGLPYTLDHTTLLNRFTKEFGIRGKPLNWFESYFSERTQSVVIRGVKSEPVPLSQGEPQGSVIGPKAYTMYTKSLGDIIEHHGLQYHIYICRRYTDIYATITPPQHRKVGAVLERFVYVAYCK